MYLCFGFFTGKSSSSSITNICDVAVNKSVNDDNNSIMKNGNKYLHYIIYL